MEVDDEEKGFADELKKQFYSEPAPPDLNKAKAKIEPIKPKEDVEMREETIYDENENRLKVKYVPPAEETWEKMRGDVYEGPQEAAKASNAGYIYDDDTDEESMSLVPDDYDD